MRLAINITECTPISIDIVTSGLTDIHVGHKATRARIHKQRNSSALLLLELRLHQPKNRTDLQ